MKQFALRLVHLLWHVSQWALTGLLLLVTAGFTAEASKYHAVGLGITPFCGALAAMAAVAILLSPPVFFRLRTKARAAGYVLLVPIFVALSATQTPVDEAYKRTPQGAAEAKAQAAADASRMQRKRENKELAHIEVNQTHGAEPVKPVQTEETGPSPEDYKRKIEACMSWRGQIPSLVQEIKNSLHNPHSFEYVQTEIKPALRNGVPLAVMEYRAQNGFGAIRTAAVTAIINPNDCSVVAQKPYDPDDF